MIFNNWNVLGDDLDKAVKSFEQLKRRHSSGTVSRRQVNSLNSCLQCLLPFRVSCKVLFNLLRFILRETINTLFFNLQCVISGYGCCDVRPRLNIYLSLLYFVSLTKLVNRKNDILKRYHGGNDCELLDHSVKVHRDLHLHFWLLDKNLCKRRFSLFCRKMMKTRTRRK